MARKRQPPAGKPKAEARWTPEDVVELAMRYQLAELEVEEGGIRVRVVRAHAPAAPHPTPTREILPQRQAQPAPAEAVVVPSNLVTVEAPMVGTFYRAPGPDAAPFVSEGDVIKEGQVLCVIEAMKLMNEIEARVAGRIAKVLVENAQPVEYGQPLFLVEPR